MHNKGEVQLLKTLQTIKGNGSFITSGVKKFTLPGLQIETIGEIGFPLNAVQIREIIKLSRKAPFGKGSQTITDTAVRSAWEIDADKLSFENKEWKKCIGDIVKKVKKGLGIEEKTVEAVLYKMLIYEEGDFFLPHKDSEKEAGMFATLVVGLPSTHTGGEIVVRFDGREEIIDFSPAASSYNIPYAAFFADCEHEIKPVTSGYRVCLVYNLLQSTGSEKISSPQFMEQAEKLAKILHSLEESSIEEKPIMILLGHQYTPANFSLTHLKHHDRPRAEALIEAAKKANYFAKLGLVTHYQMGELEVDDYDYYYSGYRRSNREQSEGTMGSIFEAYSTIEYWGEDEIPTLGEIAVEEEDVITDLDIGEGDPVEQEEEGYTGNAGMTMEYWYHYGAVILWPKSKHFNILKNSSVYVRLNWLDYYTRHWEISELNSQKYARKLISSLIKEDLTERYYQSFDFSPFVSALAKLQDEEFVKNRAGKLLASVFDKIKVNEWINLLQQYNPDVFSSMFQNIATTDDIYVINHLLEVLKSLEELKSPALMPFVIFHVQQMPEYFRLTNLHQLTVNTLYAGMRKSGRKETITAIIEKVLALSTYQEQDADWIKNVLDSLTKSLPRKYVNKVLAPVLQTKKFQNRMLAKELLKVCIRDLKARTAVKPRPPDDWRREVPQSKHYREIWEMLRPFLISPTQKVFEYRRKESERKYMERAIRGKTIDLKMETIRKGSPYTLKLIKTQAAYKRALKEWKEDTELLKKLQ